MGASLTACAWILSCSSSTSASSSRLPVMSHAQAFWVLSAFSSAETSASTRARSASTSRRRAEMDDASSDSFMAAMPSSHMPFSRACSAAVKIPPFTSPKSGMVRPVMRARSLISWSVARRRPKTWRVSLVEFDVQADEGPVHHRHPVLEGAEGGFELVRRRFALGEVLLEGAGELLLRVHGPGAARARPRTPPARRGRWPTPRALPQRHGAASRRRRAPTRAGTWTGSPSRSASPRSRCGRCRTRRSRGRRVLGSCLRMFPVGP